VTDVRQGPGSDSREHVRSRWWGSWSEERDRGEKAEEWRGDSTSVHVNSYKGGTMMFKKWSRRSNVSLAIACLTFAVVCLWGPKEANTTSFFSGTQQWAVTSNGYNLIAVYDFNTGLWSNSSWNFGNGTFTYSFPIGTMNAYYLFDNNTQRWPEAILILDVPL
jgi:hypothetical protein